MRKVRVMLASLTTLLISASTVFADIVDAPFADDEPDEPNVLPAVLLIGAAVIVIVLIIKFRKKK